MFLAGEDSLGRIGEWNLGPNDLLIEIFYTGEARRLVSDELINFRVMASI